uniref:Uncharacterized protein n=1 Tax=Caenorhabditis japonica TaxID=281687 RepID=A0A8R1HLJ2_CAEJA
MTSNDSKVIYFIARRWVNIEGVKFFTIVIPENGERTDVVEQVLTDNGLVLGDFFRLKDQQMKKMGFLTSTVCGDVAFIANISSKLVYLSNNKVFQNKLFTDSICRDNLPLGNYNISISLLPSPIRISPDIVIYFEGTNAKPFGSQVQSDNREVKMNGSGVVPRCSPIEFPHFQNSQALVMPSKIPSLAVNPNLLLPVELGGAQQVATGDVFRVESPFNLTTFQRDTREVTEGVPVVTPGYRPIDIPRFQDNQRMENIARIPHVIGEYTGMPANAAKPNLVIPVELGGPKQVVTGDGFRVESPFKVTKNETLRAVVLKYVEKFGNRTHYLWILEKHVEAVFISNNHNLSKGHFFKGVFSLKSNQKWSCSSYIEGLPTPLLAGGLDSLDRVWFTVKLQKYQEIGMNMRFARAQAKFIGEILDTESKLSGLDANGKEVNIRRKKLDDNEYVWSIFEVL